MQPGPYRTRWLLHGRRLHGDLNQAAVAQVLSAYLWDSGVVSDRDTGLPRRLKDPISRGFTGGLTPNLLRTMIEAFSMSDRDAQDMWTLFLRPQDSGLLVVRSSRAVGRLLERPRTYRTVALHEYHRVGPDRIPIDHRTVQVIRATEDTSTYTYRFDTSAAVVEVLRGGSADTVRSTELDGVYAVDITLTRPLARDETASLEYRTVFAYPAPPEPAFRRVSLGRVENVELNVEFDERACPRDIHACTWQAYPDLEPSSSTSISLGPDHSVHRFFDVIEGAGAGFTWRW